MNNFLIIALFTTISCHAQFVFTNYSPLTLRVVLAALERPEALHATVLSEQPLGIIQPNGTLTVPVQLGDTDALLIHYVDGTLPVHECPVNPRTDKRFRYSHDDELTIKNGTENNYYIRFFSHRDSGETYKFGPGREQRALLTAFQSNTKTLDEIMADYMRVATDPTRQRTARVRAWFEKIDQDKLAGVFVLCKDNNNNTVLNLHPYTD